MAKIDDRVSQVFRPQQIFFVTTAPLADDGSINLSPKGIDPLTISDACTVTSADMAGSGIETVAYRKENGRIVIMFCAFEGASKSGRMQGRGAGIDPLHVESSMVGDLFPDDTGL